MDGGRLREYLIAFALTALIARLFYKSLIALVFYIPICKKYRNICEKRRNENKRKELRKDFQNSMEIITGNLLAGYALENAFLQAQTELAELYGEEGQMQQELAWMNKQIEMNQPIEKVFAEFAARSEVEEIQDFSEVLTYAKRSGGDFVKIMCKTSENIADKIRVEDEIETMIAARKLEQKIMNVVPLFLIAYLELVSGEYLEVLYGNAGGVIIMTGCLAGYLGALRLSERMSRIEV